MSQGRTALAHAQPSNAHLLCLSSSALLQVYALEIESYMQDFAQPYLQQAGVADMVSCDDLKL